MLEARAIIKLPKGHTLEVENPVGVVSKIIFGKFRLIINMRHVNEHLKKMLMFEAIKNCVDVSEKGNHAVYFILTSGYHHVKLYPRARIYTGSN